MKKLVFTLSILAFFTNANAQKVSTRVIDNKGTIKWVLDSTTAVITRADSTIIFVTPKQLRDSLNNSQSVLRKAGNGITKTGDSISLGGTLSATTTIATSASNFFRITGLQAGSNSADSIVTINPSTGQLKIISVSNLLGRSFAINGLNKNGDTTKLGGNLTENTTITTNGRNLTVDATSGSFRVTGIGTGAATDSVLVADPATGQLKRVSSSTLLNNLKASNGVTKVGDTIQLGGTLTKPTAITTTATNTLSITGLSTGNIATDSIVVADNSTGQLKRVSSTSLLQSGDAVFTATANNQAAYTPVTGMPANVTRVWVFRNGAKLIPTTDYTVSGTTVTLTAAMTPLIVIGDVIEVQWVK
jgi:hypothetical protein